MHRFLCVSLSSYLLLWTIPGSIPGQEWTRFRGPNGSGESQSANIPANWTDHDYKWQIKLPGTGHSSPVVWGDRVYVTATTETDATQIVCCFRTSDGGTVWTRTFAAKPHRKNALTSFASSTPAVDHKRLYVTWIGEVSEAGDVGRVDNPSYVLAALDRETGKDVWRRDLGPFEAQHGFGASPILFDDVVIVPNDQDGTSSVIALNCATGKTRWTVPRTSSKAAYSTPVLYAPQGGRPQLILTSLAHGITSLDASSGSKIWELDVLKHRTVGSPMVAAGLIFAAAGEGGAGKVMVAVQPGNPADGSHAKVAYQVEGKLPYVVTPVANGTLLFLWNDQGIVTCLDAPTGKKLWEERVGGKYFGSPVRVQDRVYCISRDGEVVVLSASKQYKLLGRMKLGEASQSTPAISGGVMYLRTLSQLMAIGAGS